MGLLLYIVIGFLAAEAGNVFFLYFMPGTKLANGLGTFSGWKASEGTPEVHNLVKYLARWVANVKMIFIALMVIVFIFGNDITQWWSVLALDASIFLFWIALFPLIHKMDAGGQLVSKGYSRLLAFMITAMQAFLSIGLILVNPWNPLI